MPQTDHTGRIACVGGMSVDRKLRLRSPLVPGSSNPVTAAGGSGGVARNVAEALARLGCPVTLFSMAGRDDAGDALLVELGNAGVDTSGIGRSDEFPTADYVAVLEADGRLAFGLANMEIFDRLDARWAARIAHRLREYAVVFVDANLPGRAIERLLESVSESAQVAADPVSVAKSARLSASLRRVDLLFPDRSEAAAISGRPATTPAEVALAAAEIRTRGVGTVLVSLGAQGVHVEGPHRSEVQPAIPPRRVRDVTGAGDAFVAGYLYGVAGGGPPVLCGLAAASLALESETSGPSELSAATLRGRMDEPFRGRRLDS